MRAALHITQNAFLHRGKVQPGYEATGAVLCQDGAVPAVLACVNVLCAGAGKAQRLHNGKIIGKLPAVLRIFLLCVMGAAQGKHQGEAKRGENGRNNPARNRHGRRPSFPEVMSRYPACVWSNSAMAEAGERLRASTHRKIS